MKFDFNIPDTDQLGRFTVTALRELGLEAAATYEKMYSEFKLNPDTSTDDALDYMEDLVQFTTM